MSHEALAALVPKSQGPPPASWLPPSIALAASGPPHFAPLRPPTQASQSPAANTINYLVLQPGSTSKSPSPVRPHTLQTNSLARANLSSQHQAPADTTCSLQRHEEAASSVPDARSLATFQPGNLESSRSDQATASTPLLTRSIAPGESWLMDEPVTSREDDCSGQKRNRSPGYVDQHAAKARKLLRRNEIHMSANAEAAQPSSDELEHSLLEREAKAEDEEPASSAAVAKSGEHGCFASTLSQAVKKARDQRGPMLQEAALEAEDAALRAEEDTGQGAAAECALEAEDMAEDTAHKIETTIDAEDEALRTEAGLAANIAADEAAMQHLAEEHVVVTDQLQDGADNWMKATGPSTRLETASDHDDSERLVRMTLSYADRLLKAAAKDLEDERRAKMEEEAARKSKEAAADQLSQLSTEKQSISGKAEAEVLPKVVVTPKTAQEERLAHEAAEAAELAKQAKAKKFAADEELRRSHLQKHRELMAEKKLKQMAKGKRGKQDAAGKAVAAASTAPAQPASTAASAAAEGEQPSKAAVDARRKSELDRLAALWKVRQQQLVGSRG
eukprot:TRINITY_DN32871_c0_g1_i1.p1 TRINITY_DN32871_c0_g1~~TRINITY_DN32871_c0_g1_i1.p1  ORF type:complete len:562 (+),score=122.95 TRINITY_DN32871_c0_g1_i1:222-1907(+)